MYLISSDQRCVSQQSVLECKRLDGPHEQNSEQERTQS